MRPMLCHRYNDHKVKLTYPCYIQPKLNGIRMLYCGNTMQSRSHGQEQEKTWADNRLIRLRAALAQVPDRYILDGEIYKHGWSLQQINGAAAINALNDKDKTEELEYHIFNVIDTDFLDAPFDARHNLRWLFQNVSVKVVQTNYCETELEGEKQFKHFKSLGYEGAVYYQADAPYGFVENCGNKQNRWAATLKRKDWLDANCLITGVNAGGGKYNGMVGSFELEFENGMTFSAGSGLSDTQRSYYTQISPIGLYCRIKYEMLSDSGVPLKPTIEAILE